MSTTEKVSPTAGPWWTAGSHGDECAYIVFAPGDPLSFQVCKVARKSAERAAADARLIAAAPDMIEALRSAHVILTIAEQSGDEGVADTLAVIRAEIGRAPCRARGCQYV